MSIGAARFASSASSFSRLAARSPASSATLRRRSASTRRCRGPRAGRAAPAGNASHRRGSRDPRGDCGRGARRRRRPARASASREAPSREASPPVGLAELRSETQDDVGFVAQAIAGFDVDHRPRERRGLGQYAARAPGSVDRRVQQLGEPGELGEGLRMDHAAARVDHRQTRALEQLRGGLDVGRARLERRRAPVAGRRRRARARARAVDEVLGHVEVHDAGPPREAGAQGLAHQLGDARERRAPSPTTSTCRGSPPRDRSIDRRRRGRGS